MKAIEAVAKPCEQFRADEEPGEHRAAAAAVRQGSAETASRCAASVPRTAPELNAREGGAGLVLHPLGHGQA
jgi:hypothetical protein